MSRDSILEIQHKREQSHDSGTYQDWTLEETYASSPGQQPKNADFVTVVAVDEKPFVTVLSVDSSPPDSEEVLVYRLPGERLGFGLKFDGGVKSAEKVKKLLIQSCAEDSPASRTRASWGPLSPGDEILVIDSVPVSEMTRMDCVRALKESNVVIKLRVRQGGGMGKEEKEAPPIPPRKFPRKKELLAEPPAPPTEEQKQNPPVLPRGRQAPQAEIYTDLLSQDIAVPNESESDDTGSSISTVVSRISSTPTTCNSSFSDARSINSSDFPSPQPGKPSAYDLDKVLEPFLHLEREFSSAGMKENNIYHKLAEATNLLEEAPKPAPRQERRRPPPPPPPPRGHSETRHLPRLIDFVPKDRTDVLVPSPLLPTKPEDIQIKDNDKDQIKEDPDGTADTKTFMMDETEFSPKQNNSCPQDTFSTTFSRLPPDGHEFPTPQDKTLLVKTDSKNVSSNTKDQKPKSNFDSKKISSETCKYSWRNDEKSEKSVKDKIAMFSCPQNSSSQATKYVKKPTSAKLLAQEIIDSSFNENEIKEKINPPKPISSIKKNSLPYQSLFDVTGNFDSYKNSLINSEKTRSTLDLTENTLSNNCMPLKSEFSTLPRKSDQPKHSLDQKNYSSGNSTLTRALSFSGESKLHTRSQSLIDVGSKNPLYWKNNDELRRSSLAALAEQRKKGYSKLRGLVIPEKLVEIPTAQVVDDLPVIKSNDCLIAEKIEEDKSNVIKNEIDKLYNNNNHNSHKPPIDKSASLMPTPIWKAENNCEIPKYSPAFKRKSLSLYGTSSSVSSVSSSLSSSREELRICFNETSKTLSGANTNITRSLASLSRNPFSSHSEPKSLESITSPSISDVSYEYSQESVSPNLNACNDVLSRFKYHEGYNSDTQRSKGEERGLEEESDNDSAVSSSRSSISPPHSPMPRGKKNDNVTPPLKNTNRYDLKLKRTLSSETTASNSSSGSTLTSGSQASCSSNSGSCTSTENKRILKAQSVEAINRKNVLSSARYSSGIDSKGDVSSTEHKYDIKQSENEPNQQKMTPPEDITLLPQKKNELYPEQLNDSNETNTAPVNGNDSGFGSFHSKLEKSPIKEHEQCNELIKCETSFNIDDFTYSSHKGVDKNSNMKMNDFNDFPDGITSNDNENKWPIIENNASEYLPPSKLNRPILQVESKYEKQKEDSLPSSKTINVNSMKKVFEKGENLYLSNPRFKINLNSQISIQHRRVSSVDSTNSDDSCVPNPSHYGSVSNLQKETQFGSITSLASSTSLISQQELSQLIEEANHTLEDEGNTHEVVVVILHRDIPGGSIGITLAGGADYEAKEITVHKVLIGSPAERDGRIQKGDRILSINGKSMKGLTHYESLAILKAPRPEVVLVVSRHKGDVPEDQNSSTAPLKSSASVRLNRFSETKASNQTKGKDTKWGPPVAVTLLKDGAGLGFSLEGGKDSPYGDQPLTIKKIFTGGCAEKCGNLFAGDELLSVNNIDVSELSRIEAWSLMKRLPDGEVLLNVRHQFS